VTLSWVADATDRSCSILTPLVPGTLNTMLSTLDRNPMTVYTMGIRIHATIYFFLSNVFLPGWS